MYIHHTLQLGDIAALKAWKAAKCGVHKFGCHQQYTNYGLNCEICNTCNGDLDIWHTDFKRFQKQKSSSTQLRQSSYQSLKAVDQMNGNQVWQTD